MYVNLIIMIKCSKTYKSPKNKIMTMKIIGRGLKDIKHKIIFSLFIYLFFIDICRQKAKGQALNHK